LRGTSHRRNPKEKTNIQYQCHNLYHDNAKPHVHREVLNYLESEGIKIIRQPPNSPDLAHVIFGYSI
jgi:transposase